MRSLVLLFGMAALAVSGLSACSSFTADDIHQRGRTGAIGRDTTQYRAVDNACYDTLVEMYGKDRVYLAEAPEVEHHSWQVRSNIRAVGLDEYRTQISARPVLDPDTDEYTVNIRAQNQLRMQDHGPIRADGAFGSKRWIEAGTDAQSQAKIANSVEAKVREWHAQGRPEVGNRRDEWYAGLTRARDAAEAGGE